MKGHKTKTNKPEIICINGQYYTPIIVNKDTAALSSATVSWWEDSYDRLPKNNKTTK